MMTTRTRQPVVVFTFFTLFTSLLLSQSQRPPVFRGGVELVQLDVTVLDKTGKPVRGLTKDDFTLLEDGKPQPIEAFTEIDVPEAVHTGPAWSRDVTPDVTSNQIDNKRILVVVLDDGKGVGGQLGRKNMIETGEGLIDALGPQDLAAIIFTNQVRLSQNLTSDRNKLLTALHRYPLSGSGNGAPSTLIGSSIGPFISPARSSGSSGAVGCLSTKETLWTIRAIVDDLSTVPDRRKALIYYGGDAMPWVITPGDDPCGTYWLWREIFTAAQQGHVSINPIRPRGGINANEGYMAVAENSGGHAVTVGDVNDVAKGLQQILIENSSYYLLAYPMKPGDADGTYRRVTVKVNRQDVEVVTRRGYWTPRVKAADDPKNVPPPADIEAIAGILPSAKLDLRASAAVFGGAAGKGQATLAITVGVTQPAFPARTREIVDMLVKAYSADGDPKGSESTAIPINVPPTRAGVADAYYEVLSRIDVPKPGKYEVRLSAHSSETDERGSVYLDVDVPDFAKAKLSMSGVLLNSALSLIPVAPPRLLSDVAPATPTAERSFAKGDRVSAFLKLYQGEGKLVPVTVKTRILDAANRTVVNESDSFAPDRFGPDRSTDIHFQLPLERLSPGEHLLTFEATFDKLVVRRDIVFSVK